jgi:hypothetical protein
MHRCVQKLTVINIFKLEKATSLRRFGSLLSSLWESIVKGICPFEVGCEVETVFTGVVGLSAGPGAPE